MHTLFLIGNGFDLSCGMKTSYKDIYPCYTAEPSSSSTISEFKQTISENIDTWGDFEIAMAHYAGNLNTEAEFLECVYDFSAYAADYLTQQDLKMKNYLKDNEIMKSVCSEMQNSLRSFYFDCTHNITNIMNNRQAGYLGAMNIVSFNYTTVFDTLFNHVFPSSISAPTILHIHGILGDDPIFGVDNESQLNVGYAITNNLRRAFIKPYFNNYYDKQRVLDFESLILSSNTICTYGLSLGDSDMHWRNTLLSWLGKSSENHLFIYDYRYFNKEYIVLSQKLAIEDAAKIDLLSSWGIEPSNDLLEQIHIPIGKHLFNISPYLKKHIQTT